MHSMFCAVPVNVFASGYMMFDVSVMSLEPFCGAKDYYLTHMLLLLICVCGMPGLLWVIAIAYRRTTKLLSRISSVLCN